MKRLSLIVLALSCALAFAARSTDEIKLLSYERLHAMPTRARSKYLKEVALAFADLESAMKQQNADGKDVAVLEQLQEYLHTIADDLAPISYAHAGQAESCSMMGLAGADSLPGICFRVAGAEDCESGEIRTSVELTPGRTRAICVVDPGDHLSEAMKTTLNYGAAGGEHSLTSADIVMANSGTVPAHIDVAVKSESYQAAARTRKAGYKAAGSNAPAPLARTHVASADRIDPALTADTDGKQAAALKALHQQDKKAEENKTKSADATKDLNKSLTGETCQPPAQVRNDYIKEARLQYQRQLGGAVCMMGGNFTIYKGGVPTGKNCELVNSFPQVAKSGSPEFSCASDQVICNPLLYCGKMNGDKYKPICRSYRENLDVTCAQQSEKNDAFCDPWKYLKDSIDAPYEWDKLQQVAHATCKPGSNYRKFFCDHCNALIDRIARASATAPGATPGEQKKSPVKDDPAPAVVF
jgi:hypothetical protein